MSKTLCSRVGIRAKGAIRQVLLVAAWAAGFQLVGDVNALLAQVGPQLALPQGSTLLRQQESPAATLLLPTGPAQGDRVPSEPHEGRILRRSWRLVTDRTTLQVFAPLRDRLMEAGFDIRFECRDRDCGGFAFRFAIETIPAPDMMVHLSDFQFLSAEDSANGSALSLLVSRSGGAVYVQLIEQTPIGKTLDIEAPAETATAPASPEDVAGPVALPEQSPGDEAGAERQFETLSLMEQLTRQGRAILSGVDFASGATALTDEEIADLDELARLLQDHPEMRILLVGHTDTVGSLESNIDISRRRAEAVRAYILATVEIAPERISVAGAGFIAPIASNQTPNGKERNRRVEAVLIAL